MKELTFDQMENINGGGFWGCIGGAALAVGGVVAASALSGGVGTGAAIASITSMYGGILLGCMG